MVHFIYLLFPRKLINPISSTDPAEIVTLPVDQVVWVGQQVTLFCNVTGNPVPNITYTIVGKNGTVGYDKTLVINASSTAYVKTYTCTANNEIQSPVSAKITVAVLGKSLICGLFEVTTYGWDVLVLDLIKAAREICFSYTFRKITNTVGQNVDVTYCKFSIKPFLSNKALFLEEESC